MSKPWIKIDDLKVDIENIPGLLDRYNLLPVFLLLLIFLFVYLIKSENISNYLFILPDFLRRILESKNTHKLIPTKEEQINYFNGFLKQNNINGKDSLNEWLLENGLDDKRLDTMLYERLQVEKFKQDMFDSAIESEYLKEKELLDRVMYSVLRVENREQAFELFTQIDEMESSFSDLASKYSIGTEKKFNGIIGPVELGKLDPNLRERLRVSKSGQLWSPFEFKKNWIVLRLEKFLPSKLDDSTKIRIRNTMYEKWINKQVLKLIDEIRYKNNKDLQINNKEISML